jgi:hypothetical protein
MYLADGAVIAFFQRVCNPSIACEFYANYYLNVLLLPFAYCWTYFVCQIVRKLYFCQFPVYTENVLA